MPWVLSSPGNLWVAWGLYRKVWKKYKLNTRLQSYRDYPIPHSFVLSLTSDCNLACDHCYARVYSEPKVLSAEVLESVLRQADSLGCFFFVLTGGEPMLYPDLLDILSRHDKNLFILITNGTMISDNVAKRLSYLPHIIPIISLEGGREDTDKRRGSGIYHKIINAFNNLQKNKVLYGFSITVTSENAEQLQKEGIFQEKYPFGARLGCFIEYIPTGKMPDLKLCLSSTQRYSFRQWFLKLKEKSNIYLIHFPGDEELTDNCREAGKGFIHINPEGYIESCALLPSSKYNAAETSLEVCLRSSYLDSWRCSHTYEALENHPCMHH
ncbi:MAG: radical SAM/SPASM domain-containing protein [Candidatus Loosdrechtia sp.]|uniref:radical SAM/SPASM domain-containing protein n=1 Tax=Candidatus Loosdrechtia sp. TaxID=3101272 RepID=UPI003A63DB4F|nr:MAG: radical SAM protein [Candidatus Jettenia sp. AMX2]